MRQEAAQPGETEAERRAREAEIERQRSLEAARTARTEAERLVGEELARLIAVEVQVAAVVEQFRSDRTQLAARKDALLGWQRRVRDAKAAGADEADATYEAIRRSLRVSRDELSCSAGRSRRHQVAGPRDRTGCACRYSTRYPGGLYPCASQRSPESHLRSPRSRAGDPCGAGCGAARRDHGS